MERLHKLAAMARANHCDGVLITEAENLCYATGFVGLEGMVLVTADGKGYCFTDSRYIEAAEKAIAPWGYQVIQPDVSYPQCVAQLCQEHKLESLLFEDQDMTVASHARYTAAVPAMLIPAGEAFSETREGKEVIEVERIVAAQRIAEKALEEILPLIKPGAVEREVAAELDYRMARLGSTGVSFPTIFVSGAKSSLPHGTPGDKKIEAGDFVTIDFGAMVGGYHSDMTRTFAVGFATDEMKKVYNTVLEAQLTALAISKAGVVGKEVDATARKVISDAGYGEYFGPGYGHGLGLEVHERPSPNAGNPNPIPAGAVCSAEPGIYLPGKCGVRIEDCIVFMEDGHENLAHSPKNLIIV